MTKPTGSPVEDPATGEVITFVQGGETAEVNAAVEAAHRAFRPRSSRCCQSSRLLTIAAAVASSEPRTSSLTAAPSSAQIVLTYTYSVMSVLVSCVIRI
jgi:acyl-CoA reductase-like NAD-dependent aldehyde dehydrogenase